MSVSTSGDMLREAVKNETPVGIKAKSFMDEVGINALIVWVMTRVE